MNNKTKEFLARAVSTISPELYVRLSYFHNRNKFPNLKNPKNISEIILSKIVTGEIINYSQYADKVGVRDYIIKAGFEDILPDVYGVWSDIDEIDFDSLPDRFVLKTNNGCGNHYMCKDKGELNIAEAKEVLHDALRNPASNVETHYKKIVPKVFCEEFIDDGTGEIPVDYKFHCLDGDVRCILVYFDRIQNVSFKLKVYNTRWEELNYLRGCYKSALSDIPKPKNIDKMIRIAETISKDFDFVRIDLYDTGDKVFFGELTFTPQRGIMSYFTNDAIDLLGRSVE